MKKLIRILMIFACILYLPTSILEANETSKQPSVDFIYTDKEPQYNEELQGNEEPEPEEDTTSLDAPVDEDTYEEQPGHINDEPHLADGETGRGTIESPDKYWAKNGYPDDISYAYEAGGEMFEDGTQVSFWEIGIIDGNENRKQEIVDMFSADCLITFTDCKYSYNQREAVYNEIQASTDDNIHGVIMVQNSEVVMVEVSEEHLKEYADKFNQKYGSFVVVADNLNINKISKEDLDIGGIMLTGSINKKNTLWIWAIIVVFLIGGSFLFFNQIRLIPAVQTTKGTLVTKSASISRKQTITEIKNSEVGPSDEVLKSILHRINENE